MSNNVGSSTCVVCRGPCTRHRLTCRKCYEEGHRPLEDATDAEIDALMAINQQPHASLKKQINNRRAKHTLPENCEDLPFCFAAILPANGNWYYCGTEIDRNTAYKLVKYMERQGLQATQRKFGSEYRLFARKIRRAA